MFSLKQKDQNILKNIKSHFKDRKFQRIVLGILTIIFAFIIIESGAAPQKYKLTLGESSKYNILSNRDVEDKNKTKQNAQKAADAVPASMTEIKGAAIEVRNEAGRFIKIVEESRAGIEESLQNQGITRSSRNYGRQLEAERNVASVGLEAKLKDFGLNLAREQVMTLIKAEKDEINSFKDITEYIVSGAITKDITADNLAQQIIDAQNNFEATELRQEFKNIGNALIRKILKPNKAIDYTLTEELRNEAYNDVINNKKIMIKKDERILAINETVTKEKYELLKELNLLEESSFDFALAGGILIVLLMLSLLLVLYMNHFCRKHLSSKNDMLLLYVVIILILVISRGTYGFAKDVYQHSGLLIPMLMAGMLISILLDLKLAIIVNFVLTIAVSLMIKGDMSFIYINLISGTFSTFIVSKANQRNQLFMSGVKIAFLNVLIIVSLGIIDKHTYQDIVTDSIVVFINGLLSIILTIGTMPFWESIFNVITPLRLLELANPNQPLIKRLLMEAPGTYHHSLMVGNMAEVATEAIGGNALLARVGAYFHDVGKLKRPNFFKENQLSDNPHDRMTANLSTLVITAHTGDGVEIAKKHKIPLIVRDIISQHHGTTLVAYFYHKAKKGEKGEEVKPENFRYEGPKPCTKEAAVVMLADSVEAAVRSMVDKTEGKIEGLVRKIIKDKLDDGQLDQCDLTLKDLDDTARSFMKVLSGLFHEREEYPEIKTKAGSLENAKAQEIAESENKFVSEGVKISNDSIS
ncbi:hypothetical protein DFR58_11685 [Anaerobacterium chartisolvens]|uniref:HD/PDEase domain-containing protein n=1 Tax=Anaerobacterium chartisolvens TaxID=1297424 RepID=A0A369AX33_9FIRM|nr:HDIG domain-containing metalloprotein [Anaerobacterium chartisolvens]RCX13849.1 hypothetical protein DFR58_11685 [Anaerobacterium chartisolvens]